VPPEGVNLGVNLAALRRVLGMVNPGDQLRLKWDPARPDLMNVQFASVARRRNYDIDMRLMDIDAEGLDIPDMEYSHVIRLSSADFYQCVADCAQFGDTVGVAVGADRVVTAVDGDEAKTFMSLEGDAHVTPDGATPVNMKFSTKYILAFAKARDNDKTVTLKMLDGFPICVEFGVGGHDDSRLTFYLAPKMDDEDETNT
jgi:proliferating cell nuclear antigen